MKTPKHILVPVDLSTHSLAALQYAESIANLFQASISIVHVVDRGTKHEQPEEVFEHESRARHAITNLLIDHHLVCCSMPILIRHGSSAAEILAAAKEVHADLIVMSTHGRTGIRHALLGSVAEKVVRMSSVPVLTVKPPEFSELIELSEGDVAASLHIARWDDA
jgi:nucleotide-binding universal stress UspA family protein